MLQCWLSLFNFHQMAPLYITLLNIVLIDMFSIHWPWSVQKSYNYFGVVFYRHLGKCRVAYVAPVLAHPAAHPVNNSTNVGKNGVCYRYFQNTAARVVWTGYWCVPASGRGGPSAHQAAGNRTRFSVAVSSGWRWDDWPSRSSRDCIVHTTNHTSDTVTKRVSEQVVSFQFAEFQLAEFQL